MIAALTPTSPEPEESAGTEIAPFPKPFTLPEDFYHRPTPPAPESFKDCDSCDSPSLLIGSGCQNSLCGMPDYSTP